MNWQLQWVSRALYVDPSNLFNGNTFHPHPNVVALTDHMLTLAVVNAPLSLLSDSPWFGYNVLILLAYYLSCVGGYWFMREVTGSHQAGVWAGIFWAFLFFRIHHIGHLQILSYQWMPFVAATLIRIPAVADVCASTGAFRLFRRTGSRELVSCGDHGDPRPDAGLAPRRPTTPDSRARHGLRHCRDAVRRRHRPRRHPLSHQACRRHTSVIGPPTRSFRAIGCHFELPRATSGNDPRPDPAGRSVDLGGEDAVRRLYRARAGSGGSLGPMSAADDAGRDESARTPMASKRWIATGVCLVVIGFVLAKGFISSQHVRLPLFYLAELPD